MLPPELLERLTPLRTTMLELLGEKKLPLAGMIKRMKKHQHELLGCHRSFKLDMAFLEHRAEELLKEKVVP